MARSCKKRLSAVSMLYRYCFTADIAVIFIDVRGITEVTNLLFGDASNKLEKKGSECTAP